MKLEAGKFEEAGKLGCLLGFLGFERVSQGWAVVTQGPRAQRCSLEEV